jgi:TRAP transporter TAXI family solute receptor
MVGVALFSLCLLVLVQSAGAEEPIHLFRIGTGGQTGVYYPIGKLIAQGLTGKAAEDDNASPGEGGIPGTIGVAQNSAGSIDNARAVTQDEIEAGLVQADIAFQALHAQQAFEGNPAARSIRAVASLYSEKLQIVTRRDAHIQHVDDFRGKRISIDEVGSGALAVMQIVLDAHGLTESDFLPVYLKPVFTQERMADGQLQGFAMMAGAPMEAVTRLLDVGLHLVPIPPAMADSIHRQYPYLAPGAIPDGVYRDIPETPTLAVHALLVVSASLDDNRVYQATACLWSQRTRALLVNGHPLGREITLTTALDGLSIPLHPGAERYYRDHSVLK